MLSSLVIQAAEKKEILGENANRTSRGWIVGVRMRLSLRNRIILFFTGFLLVTILAISVYGITELNRIFDESEQNLGTILTTSITKEIEDVLDYTEVNVKSVVDNEKVQELFSRKDRGGLLRYMNPLYESLKSEFPQAHFHLPNSVSFLRLQKPEKHGDDLSGFRFTVNEANASKRTVRGIEKGVSGFGFRVVMPVFHNGNHIGSFEYGKEMEHRFLNALRASYSGNFALYHMEDEGEPQLISSTFEDAPAFEHHEVIPSLRAGESLHRKSRDAKWTQYYIPFRSFDGKTLGFLEFHQDRQPLVAHYNRVIWSLVIATTLILIVVIVVTFFYLNRAFRPLRDLVGDAQVIARGDFTKTFDLKRKDEIGMIGRSLHNISANLKRMIREINGMSVEVANNTEGLSSTSEELTASYEEVRRNVVAVSNMAQDQMTSVSEARSSIEDIAARIGRLNESVHLINQAMNSVRASSNAGASASERIEEKILDLRATAEVTTENIEKLHTSSKEIETIVTAIQGIANETNMLALNASIEAARAGDAGRGFAVVANKVGDLAEQSRSSTNSIDALIKEIQGDVVHVVESMSDSNTRLEQGVQAAGESRAVFQAIEKEVGQVVVQVEEITRIVEQVYQNIDGLIKRFETIFEKSDATAHNLDAVKEIFGQQTQAMNEITQATISIAERSGDLKNSMTKFKY